jgi:hypothetical protein
LFFILNVSIFNDAAETNTCEMIEWGIISSGTTATERVYIKMLANTAETVYMSTADWNPSSTISVLMLTWDKEGGQLSEGAVALATLTLTTAQDTEI